MPSYYITLQLTYSVAKVSQFHLEGFFYLFLIEIKFSYNLYEFNYFHLIVKFKILRFDETTINHKRSYIIYQNFNKK